MRYLLYKINYIIYDNNGNKISNNSSKTNKIRYRQIPQTQQHIACKTLPLRHQVQTQGRSYAAEFHLANLMYT
jgi:hypothetical protein